MGFSEYTTLHVEWMEDRGDGILSDTTEAKWAEKLDAVWQCLSAMQRGHVKVWLAEQNKYRHEHGMPSIDDGIIDYTPGELAVVEFEGAFDFIIRESPKVVVFQTSTRLLEISRDVLLDYDKDEGRFWLDRRDAEKLGLLH